MIDLKDLTAFLPHVGGRLGEFTDPPGASFCVEGGRFAGELYVGVAFSPAAPTVGATRLDTVIANPATGLLELIAGTENSGLPPDIGSYAGAGSIAHVQVIGRTNEKVLIERSHLFDLRSVVPASQSSFRMLEIATITLGSPDIPGAGTKIGSFTVVASKVWTYLKADVRGTLYVARGNAVTWIDLEYAQPISEFHLVVQPYDSLIAAAPNGAGDHPNGVGVTWRTLPSVAGKPRVRIVVGAAEGFGGVDGEQAFRVFALTNLDPPIRPLGWTPVQVHLQAWGRV